MIFRALAILPIFLLWPASSALAQTETDWSGLNGTWEMTAGKMGGQDMPKDQLAGYQFKIQDGNYQLKLPGLTETGKLVIQVPKGEGDSAKPGSMDIVIETGPNKGKTVLAIYKINKANLTVCFSLKNERPAEFISSRETPSSILLTYESKK